MRTLLLPAILLLLDHPTSAADRPLDAADADAGRSLYLAECSACHGERGDGAGPAATYLDPRPRDLTRGVFKLRTTPSGQPPTTADVLRTIEHGMPGSSMPAYADLPAPDRRRIAAHVLRLAGLLDGQEPTPVPAPGAPPPATPASVARGKVLYAKAGCDSCHGEMGAGDGEAAHLKDDEGHPIRPRDFTAGIYRSGPDRVALYYRIFTGLDGTPMPEYPTDFTTEERFALVDYLLSLRRPDTAASVPADQIAAGRVVAARHSCLACHLLDDGRGGAVGPDLRATGRRRDAAWLRTYLKAPRAHGPLDRARVYRMPTIALSEADLDVLARYVVAAGTTTSP